MSGYSHSLSGPENFILKNKNFWGGNSKLTYTEHVKAKRLAYANNQPNTLSVPKNVIGCGL